MPVFGQPRTCWSPFGVPWIRLELVAMNSRLKPSEIRIVPYNSNYADAFYQINKAWIDRYFTMEPKDSKTLENPEQSIIAKGGQILVALYGDDPVGVCALIPSSRPECKFELGKMGVREDMQGQGVGRKLCVQALEMARQMGAHKIFLESNTVLKPALNLYTNLGFYKVETGASPYKRSNICMELKL